MKSDNRWKLFEKKFYCHKGVVDMRPYLKKNKSKNQPTYQLKKPNHEK